MDAMISLLSVAVPKFSCGRLVITRGALTEIPHAEAEEALLRHMSGDWGELDSADKAINEARLLKGGRLLSTFLTADGVHFWIVTEANRSSTTILLPEECE